MGCFLSPADVDRARSDIKVGRMQAALALEWIQEHGRPIDRGCVADELGQADKTAVADVLAAYQNSDGGMGRALEPDIRVADSSVRTCTIALQILARYRFEQPSDLLDGVSRFLVKTYDEQTAAWPAVPPNVFDAPHAPWWGYRPPSQYLINPRPEILGYICRWPEFVPAADVERISGEVADYLKIADKVEIRQPSPAVDIGQSQGTLSRPRSPDHSGRRKRVAGVHPHAADHHRGPGPPAGGGVRRVDPAQPRVPAIAADGGRLLGSDMGLGRRPQRGVGQDRNRRAQQGHRTRDPVAPALQRLPLTSLALRRSCRRRS